jgi:hypothetical protein
VEQEQYKHIENKIRDAAKHHEPAFDENAWEKMEQLLDAEKPDRKPILWVWFLLPVLLCTIAVLLYTNHRQHAQLLAANEVIEKEKKAGGGNKNSGVPQGTGEDGGVAAVDAYKPESNNPESNNPESNNPESNNPYTPESMNPRAVYRQRAKTAMQITAPAGEEDIADAAGDEIFNKKINGTDNNTPAEEKNAEVIKPTEKKKTSPEENKATDPTTTTSKEKTAAKEKKSALSKFYLLGAAGVENSATKLLSFNGGKTRMKYGAGLGYSINKRMSVQAGFYASHKEYSAPGSAYNPKAGTYLSRVKIISLDADCMVYDIPVTLRYDFYQKNKNNLYATAGLSSYIMKSEDYDYRYTRNGVYYEGPYSYYGNRHLFSVLNVSVGAERKLTDKLSVQVEPSVSVPLKGVGDGRVKLFSAGVSIGARYFPFRKK